MLHQYLNSIKKGSAKEVALASHAIGLLALTAGSGKKAQEILEEAVSPISEALKSRSDSSKITSLLDCLAVITFVGGNEPEESDKWFIQTGSECCGHQTITAYNNSYSSHNNGWVDT